MGTDQEPCTRLHLWHDLAAVADARRALVCDLEAREVDRRSAEDTVLVFSELASNAVEHGTPQDCGHVEVTWCVYTDRVRITVHGEIASDLGEDVLDRLRPGPPSAVAPRGRGLAIVDHVCDQWGVDLQDGGVTVTAELAFSG